ncbi:MAG: DUF4340 domain-containing protein [Thermoflexales bacterium]|nr:DUF4340 domain-containing protein [Thermoflexales bacterium]
MTQRNRILAGVLAVQLIIAAVVFVPRVLPTQSAAAPLLGTLQATDVTGLTIQEQGGQPISLAKKNGTWVLPAADDFAASPDKITAFVEKLIGLKTDPLVTRTANSHARLQVAQAAYVRQVDLTLADGSVKTLYLGSASGGATHVRVNGQDEVYLARGLNSFEASTAVAGWIDAAYVSVPQDKILSATIENAQGKFEFTQGAANQWTLKGLTADQTFNPDSAVTLLARLSSITMVKPLGKTAKPEYGLDKPTATVTVILSDTASTKVSTLKIGTKDADGNYPVISSDSTYYVSVAGFNVDGYVTAKLDTFLVAAAPTPIAAPTLEPVTSTAPVTTTEPVSATVPITPTAAP